MSGNSERAVCPSKTFFTTKGLCVCFSVCMSVLNSALSTFFFKFHFQALSVSSTVCRSIGPFGHRFIRSVSGDEFTCYWRISRDKFLRCRRILIVVKIENIQKLVDWTIMLFSFQSGFSLQPGSLQAYSEACFYKFGWLMSYDCRLKLCSL